VNVPNILTIIRFLIIPVFGYFLCAREFITAAILFIAGGVTDVLDGYIARKYDLVSSWGKIADPVADKLMQLTALLILSVVLQIIPIEFLIIILVKETLMGIGALILYKRNNYVVSANWYGKMTTVVFYLAIIMMMFDEPFSVWSIWGIPSNKFVFILAIITALFAFLMYVKSYFSIKKKNENEIE
jgi:cardiolipin synthase